MRLRPWHAATLVLLAVGAGAVAPASAPVSVSYVVSESMQPTLDPGDGYVLVPAGDVEAGDVVTFYSQTEESYVTHRVVRETDDGFVTKGDNNPSTDQAGDHPPVERSQIVGKVLTVGGSLVVIPNLGTGVETLRSHLLVVVLGAVLVAFGPDLLGGGQNRPGRDVLRVRDVVRPVTAAGIVCIVGFVLLTATHAAVPYAVEPGGGPTGKTLPAGESTERTHTVTVARSSISTVVVGAEGGDVVETTVTERTDRGALADQVTLNATVRVPPQEAGSHATTVSVYTYPETLPEGVLSRLHDIHPVVAAVASTLALFSPVLVGYLLFVDGGRIVRLPRRRSVRRFLEESDR